MFTFNPLNLVYGRLFIVRWSLFINIFSKRCLDIFCSECKYDDIDGSANSILYNGVIWDVIFLSP